MTNTETLVNDLIQNQEYYKEVISHIKLQKDQVIIENPLEYGEEINKQYQQMVRFVIAGIQTGKYGISVEECLTVLESTNLEEYLKWKLLIQKEKK